MNNIMEVLDKMQFFGGQRAGRELWADKPTDVQDADIESFNENIEAIRDYIQQLEEDIKNIREGNPVGAVALVGRELLARLQAQIPRWISVEARLPKRYEHVLVSTRFTDEGEQDVEIAYLALDRWRKPDGPLFGKVTHWMPLPLTPSSLDSESTSLGDGG